MRGNEWYIPVDLMEMNSMYLCHGMGAGLLRSKDLRLIQEELTKEEKKISYEEKLYTPRTRNVLVVA